MREAPPSICVVRKDLSLSVFKPGDIVRCPSGRRAKVLGPLPQGKMDAVYLGPTNVPIARDRTILDPRHVSLIEELSNG